MPQDDATLHERGRVPTEAGDGVPLSAPKPPATSGDGSTNAGASDAASAAVPKGRGRPRSRARIWMFGLALIAIGAAVTYTVRHFSYAGAHPSTDDAYVQGDTTIMSAKVVGRVARVHVKGYQQVRAGELLVELDPVDAEIAVQQARAGLDGARTRVHQAEAALIAQRHQASAAFGQARAARSAAMAHVPQSQTTVALEDQTVRESISMARAQVSATAAQVKSAQSTLVKARNDLARAQALFADGAISAQQVDQAQAAYDAANAQNGSAADTVTQARAALAQAEASRLRVPIRRLDVTAALAQQAQADAGVEAARAGVAQAEAQLAAARQQLEYTRVTASADAIVGSDVPVQPGQVVQPGQTLLTLVFSSHKWVQANFKETQLGRVRVGQPATVRVDLLGRTFHGHVERLGPATGSALSILPPQNATGNFTKVVQRVPVRIALDDAPDTLQIGLSVEATVDATARGTPATASAEGSR